MEKRDARKLTADVQEEIRRQAVKQHLNGKNNTRVAEAFEVHRSTVSGWIKRYKQKGLKDLKAQKVRRKAGRGMHLSVLDQDTLRKKIDNKHPEQLNLCFALWRRETVGELIPEETAKHLTCARCDDT